MAKASVTITAVPAEKSLSVRIPKETGIPVVEFSGDWNIRDLTHTKRLMSIRYREYIRGIRRGQS